MPSTHLSLHYHIIFSTKNRVSFIDAIWRSRLHKFLGGSINTAGGHPETIGGVADHVHILMGLKATHCLANVVRDIKSASSRWVHEEIKMKEFEWQDGYGAFTVSASMIDAVRDYIAKQEIHHRKRTFQEEYMDFLQQSGVQYNPDYVW